MSKQMQRGRILLALTGHDAKPWAERIRPHRDVSLTLAAENDPSIDYAVVWKQPHKLLARLPNLRAVFSMGAGVDHVFDDPSLPDVPIVRVVDPNLTQHMVEYVVWRVMDHHRQGAFYRERQARREWDEASQRTTSDVAVGIMGLGNLGRAAAKALKGLGFHINGWSRRARPGEGTTTFHGDNGLIPFLNATDILVVLLPLTPATEGILTYDLLRELRRRNGLGGAVLINAARGRLQQDLDILRALEDGTLKEASLDVFEVEPLPLDSPLWKHPRLFITPHAAATSDPAHLVGPMLAQMDAFERGEPLQNVVDRESRY